MPKKIKTAKKKNIKKVNLNLVEKIKRIKISKKSEIVFISILAVLLLITALFYKFGIVATVNGKAIYRYSYLNKLQKADKTVLEALINDSLIEQEAKKKGLLIEEKEIEETIKNIETQISAQGMTLDEALKAENMSKEDLEKQIRSQKIAEKLASPSAEPSQEEIDAFLKDNKDYLPKTSSKEELQELAITQLKSQAENEAINNWFESLKSSAKIIYR